MGNWGPNGGPVEKLYEKKNLRKIFFKENKSFNVVQIWEDMYWKHNKNKWNTYISESDVQEQRKSYFPKEIIEEKL